MQRVGTDGRKRIIFDIICILIIGVCIFLDRYSKVFFADRYREIGKTTVIDGFFYLTFSENSGAAWSFLAGKSWAQLFFKVLTVIALILFIGVYVYARKKDYEFLKIGVSFIISGTVGNFIDRLMFGKVTDFISFVFGNYVFPTFNLADTFLTVGIICVIIHLLFLDKNGLFIKKAKDGDNK